MPRSGDYKLGSHQIISLIGKGGMGEVYRTHSGVEEPCDCPFPKTSVR
jgi:hypothetical protein